MYPKWFFLNTYLETVFFPSSSFSIVITIERLAKIEPSVTKVCQGLLIVYGIFRHLRMMAEGMVGEAGLEN